MYKTPTQIKKKRSLHHEIQEIFCNKETDTSWQISI